VDTTNPSILSVSPEAFNARLGRADTPLVLDVRLAKPGVYTLHRKGRRAGPLDTWRAAHVGTRVVLALVPVVVAIQLLVAVAFSAWMST